MGLNANDPFEDTETPILVCAGVSAGRVSMPTIRSRILKLWLRGTWEGRAGGLNANDPFEDTETFPRLRVRHWRLGSQCQRSVRGY